MPIAPIQTSQPNCHCPLEGSPSRKVCCTAKYNLGPPQPAGWAIRYVAASQRHCEQSEAIHSFFMPRHGLLRFACNDGWTYLCLLAALVARGLHLRLPPWRTEGAGKTGCLLHPRSRVRFALTKLHTSIQGSANTPAFPAQWLYGLLRALPGERLFCLRYRRNTSRQRSASTAAPEPHDFTVRSSCTRQSQLS